ncbi:MAG: monovalent cation/H(+) antiporter subunit G [Archaeoglobaceae archaeon]|nr:monovalent cation/H(+) antiporter subunit G [Archaeoglobaceae archaeon]MCX8152767.1 monovalent cation/H(+) antiporter subunit G [Archaeoglobaceae archaeon]MDW8013474.1 monovalent cation/H(+) antiporter subunit G [Archaeoglobaceae archaeon]
MSPINLISAILIAIGSAFMFLGALGLIRFPDFYTRTHAIGKCDTMGQLFIIVGCTIYEGLSFISIKLVLITLFYLFSIPAATHAIVKAAFYTGVKVWKKGDERM